ncbi:hypothetical protein [Sphingobacterium daejeonense]|uniref:hypothetical protein n=2 Tax=Sphingobacterium daejeonense TaxID=371142 RepID=UPI003D3239F3
MKLFGQYILIIVCCFLHLNSKILLGNEMPQELKKYISHLEYSKIDGKGPKLNFNKVDSHIYKVDVSWDLQKDINISSLYLNIYPNFNPTFHWAPHLTPTDNHIIAQHVFRSPAMIVQDKRKSISIIPDVTLLEKKPVVPWYLDLNARENVMTIGQANSKITDHVLYEKEDKTHFSKGIYTLSFYVLVSSDQRNIENPFASVNSFMWQKWGSPLYAKGEPLSKNNLDSYVDYTYQWAFNHWRDAVWQEFDLNGRRVGAPTFIVNVTQSPNYPEEINEREFRSIWNQAWFNSLRSASGLFRYAKRKGVDSLLRYANQTKELALSFPQINGFFSGLIGTEMVDVDINGKKHRRSAGWDTHYFGNSNRNPFTWDPKTSPYHILDMSYTAMLMLNWYTELEKDERLLNYSKSYAESLLRIQRPDGYFPSWLSLGDQKDMEILSKSPESAMSVSFLLKLYQVLHDEKYKNAALKALSVIEDEIVPIGKWEDFETYWSCSRYGHDSLVDKKLVRNNMFKQNTLSIYYVAHAFMEAYRVTNEQAYLMKGQRVMDELLMWQAVWQPSFIYIHALGGFGVMNADAEWNDSRQSLFAELIMEYGKELDRKDYMERGISALKASFVMMYSPENIDTKEQWQRRWPFLGEKDYGFMMENYGHDGRTDANGIGIGEFTIYDWGNGAAAEAVNRVIDHWGPDFMDKW